MPLMPSCEQIAIRLTFKTLEGRPAINVNTQHGGRGRTSPPFADILLLRCMQASTHALQAECLNCSPGFSAQSVLDSPTGVSQGLLQCTMAADQLTAQQEVNIEARHLHPTLRLGLWGPDSCLAMSLCTCIAHSASWILLR